MHRSPSRCRQNFQIRKIQRFEKSDTDISDLIIVVLIEMKFVRNDMLNNLYLDDKFPILHCSPSGSLHSLTKSQILWYLKSDTVISNDTVHCFDQNKGCQKLRYEQIWTLCSNPLGYTVFTPRDSEIGKIQPFLRNYILNNLYLHNKLLILHRCTSTHGLPKSQIWWYF